MPTYKNVTDKPIDWVATGHMEPGEVKSLADEINHPSLKRVDDNEAVDLQAVEPSNDQAPTAAQLAADIPQLNPPAEPAVPAPVAAVQAPASPSVQQPAPAAPAAAQPTNVNQGQGA